MNNTEPQWPDFRSLHHKLYAVSRLVTRTAQKLKGLRALGYTIDFDAGKDVKERLIHDVKALREWLEYIEKALELEHATSKGEEEDAEIPTEPVRSLYFFGY
jgi:hypothetical protein